MKVARSGAVEYRCRQKFGEVLAMGASLTAILLMRSAAATCTAVALAPALPERDWPASPAMRLTASRTPGGSR